MAKAIATYKCPDCGATVERRIDGFNRRDADSKRNGQKLIPFFAPTATASSSASSSAKRRRH